MGLKTECPSLQSYSTLSSVFLLLAAPVSNAVSAQALGISADGIGPDLIASIPAHFALEFEESILPGDQLSELDRLDQWDNSLDEVAVDDLVHGWSYSSVYRIHASQLQLPLDNVAAISLTPQSQFLQDSDSTSSAVLESEWTRLSLQEINVSEDVNIDADLKAGTSSRDKDDLEELELNPGYECAVNVASPGGLNAYVTDERTAELSWQPIEVATGYMFYALEVETEKYVKFWLDDSEMISDRLRPGHTYKWTVAAGCPDEQGDLVLSPKAPVQSFRVPSREVDPGKLPEAAQELNVYTAENRLIILSVEDPVTRIELMDMSGKLINAVEGRFFKRVESLTRIPRGSMLVRVMTQSGQILSRKVMVQ